MRYQLVLQWTGSSIEDYDAMIEIEELLIEGLPDESEIDGHDAGAGEVNIFIHTNSPQRSFAALQPILSACNRLHDVRIAFREMSKDEYTILWPTDLKTFKVT
jgi:hypothetical protein